jgi:hypothetical protein
MIARGADDHLAVARCLDELAAVAGDAARELGPRTPDGAVFAGQEEELRRVAQAVAGSSSTSSSTGAMRRRERVALAVTSAHRARPAARVADVDVVAVIVDRGASSGSACRRRTPQRIQYPYESARRRDSSPRAGSSTAPGPSLILVTAGP